MNNAKHVLVTGAGGYIGRHVVTALLDAGYQVTAVNLKKEAVDERAFVVQKDIFDMNPKDAYLALNKPDVCIHLAWRDGFLHNSDTHLEALPKHYSFLKGLIESGLKHLAVIGTMHEIGYWEGAIDETTTTNPTSFYGIAKNSLRQALKIEMLNKDAVFQWLRVFYITGDDRFNNSIFAKILQWENEGKESFPFTSGKNEFDFIDIKDLADYIVAAISQTEVSGIINCCSGEPTSLKNRVEQFIKQHNLKIKPEFNKFPDRPYDSPSVWGCNKKMLQILSNKQRLK